MNIQLLTITCELFEDQEIIPRSVSPFTAKMTPSNMTQVPRNSMGQRKSTVHIFWKVDLVFSFILWYDLKHFTFTQYVQTNVQESPTRGRASQCWRQCTSVDLQNYSKTTSSHSVKFHKANLAENCFLQTFANSSQTSGIVWKIFNFDSSWRYFLHLNTLKYFSI